MFFFDSHGFAWATCDGDHPAAEAFGPRGIARPADCAEFGVVQSAGQTAWAATMAAGRVDDSDEWSVVT